MKIAITLEDGRFSPPSTMSELGTLLTHVGDQTLRKGGAGLEGALSLGTVFGPARITVEAPESDKTDSLRETGKGAAPETRRDRLARLLIWECFPRANGTARLVAFLAAPSVGPPIAQRSAIMWFEGTEDAFFRMIRHVRDSLLDEAEALIDALS